MKKRQELICWNCKEQFSILLPEPLPDNLKHPCSYCKTECMIDFTEREETQTVFRGDGNQPSISNLPEILKTRKAE